MKKTKKRPVYPPEGYRTCPKCKSPKLSKSRYGGDTCCPNCWAIVNLEGKFLSYHSEKPSKGRKAATT